MKIYLAVDILRGEVVRGYMGKREIYKPLNWGLAKSTIPNEYLKEMGAKNVYFADLDRIEGFGDNNTSILNCADLYKLGQISSAIINRGTKSDEGRLTIPESKDSSESADTKNKREWADSLEYVISSETCRGEQKKVDFEFFSFVIKDKLTIPDGKDPIEAFSEAKDWNFKGGIVMNLSSVGAEDSMGGLDIESIRKAYPRPKILLYGGGVNSIEDLDRLYDAGYDGAIVTTAFHKKRIPIEILRSGEYHK